MIRGEEDVLSSLCTYRLDAAGSSTVVLQQSPCWSMMGASGLAEWGWWVEPLQGRGAVSGLASQKKKVCQRQVLGEADMGCTRECEEVMGLDS